MNTLTVRRLLVDLETPFARHWCGGDAFLTALFNALSMSFPVGEQFFIDAVRAGHQALPEPQRAALAAQVQGFIGQEATHRRIHSLFNAQLERQGLVNDWEVAAKSRLQLLHGADPRHALALTAANEHFTALFAQWLLSHPQIFGNTEPRLRNLWLWHCAEEAEHKSTAFDLYQALGGNHAWRVKWMRRVSVIFLADTAKQTLRNLRRDGSLYQPATWASAARHLLGRRGLLTCTWRPWWRYRRHDFHPAQQDSALGAQWLAQNTTAYKPLA